MAITMTFLLVLTALLCGFAFRTRRRRQEAKVHSIVPEALLQLMQENHELLLFDVRLPLDLLAHSEIIPGAVRLPPKEVQRRAESISKQKDIVIYGTCLDTKTLRLVIRMTEKLGFFKLKMLDGGFEGWKAKGFPVEAYTTSFHLDTQGLTGNRPEPHSALYVVSSLLSCFSGLVECAE